MKLREKTWWIVGGVLSLGVVVFLVGSPLILSDQYRRMETAKAQNQVEQIEDVFQGQVQDLDVILKRWASWDSAHRFMETRDPQFIRENLTGAALSGLDLNLIVFLATDGQVPFAGLVEPVTSSTASVPDAMLAWVRKIMSPPSSTATQSSGFSAWQGQPWLLASAPISTSDSQGSSGGTLVFGRRFDAVRLERISTEMGLPSLQLLQTDAESKAGQVVQVQVSSATETTRLIPASDGLIGYVNLPSLPGTTGLKVEVTLPRIPYEQGQEIQTEMVIAWVTLGLFMAAILVVLFTRTVTSPVTKLSQDVRAVSQATDLSARVPMNHQSPEMAALSSGINRILDEVQTAQESRKEEEARYRTVVERTTDCILLADPVTKRILEGNRAFRRLLQFEGDVLPELTLYHVLSLEPRQVDSLVQRALAKQQTSWDNQTWQRQDGSTVETETSISLIRMGNRDLLCLMARDLSLRKEAETRLDQMTFLDLLTGLANRVSLNQRLSQAMAVATLRQTYLALLLLDLDYFRNVNDTLGHQAGDRLLVLVSERLQKLSLEGELARLGGDEFALLLPTVKNPLQAEEAVRSLQEAFRDPFYINGKEVTTTASIGVALFPTDAVDPDTLLKYADTALNKAKALGRNHAQFSRPTINLEVAHYVELRNHLLHALERKELAVCYQPQVDSQGRLLGSEALLRWTDRALGVIPPERFIPLAEETGLILPIGEWLLQTVTEQVKGWQEAGLETGRTWVNLSPRQLDQPRFFVEAVRNALKRSGLAVEALGLEITESLAMRDLELSLRVLGELREIGLAIALDDFGTGYSSFSSLARFPIQRVKIDRSFLSLQEGLQSRAALQAGIIFIAHGLGLEALAEGVERSEDLSFLLDLECDGFQGTLLGAPMTPQEFAQLLRDRPRWPFFPG